MQLCDVTFAIVDAEHGDQVLFSTTKTDVTVAEIAILRALHGTVSVRDISPTRMDARSHADERERLTLVYGEKVVAAAFPGAAARLPSQLIDIGESIQEILDEPVVETAARPILKAQMPPKPKTRTFSKSKAPAKKRVRGQYGNSDDDIDPPDTGASREAPPAQAAA